MMSPAPSAIAAVALLAAGGFSALEWRRPDRRHRTARIGATFLAVAALASLGWRSTTGGQREAADAPGSIEAALWTPGAAADEDPGGPAIRYRFALPGAAAPADATLLPDAATLRRRFPTVGTLHVHGDGLEGFDLDALRGLRVVFHSAPPRGPGPAVSFVRCPRELPLGEPLTVQGRVGGVPPGKTVALALEAPDGTITDAATAAADAEGEADFAVGAAPPPAAGRFVWRLRVGSIGEALGVAVVPPELPRVLALAAAPRFDTAELRRWFERAGGTLTARTRVGTDRFRFESAHDPPPSFPVLDAPLLAGFDLVLADGRALAALTPPERDALRAAVADTGLGVLVLADDATLPGASGVPPEVAAGFLPWKLAALGNAPGSDGAEDERLVRAGWSGQTRTSEIPVPSAPFEIVPQEGQTPLVHDGQGHVLAAAAARGRGQIALTFVRETGRWTRGNDPGAFAAYWSFLFTRLAREMPGGTGRWALVGGEAGPVFVDQPLELAWSGRAAVAGTVTAEGDADGGGVALPLAQDAAGPGRWRGTFWPRRAGWHRVAASGAGGWAMDFFVAPAGDWAALTAARRRAATGRFAAASVDAPVRAASPGREGSALPSAGGWWFALFLAGAGYLWAERRRTA